MKMWCFLIIMYLPSQIYLAAADCRVNNFDPYPEPGKALVNHVIDELTLPTDQLCRVKCYLNHNCVSYNLGPSSTLRMMLCQLNDADRYQYPQDYQDIPGFSYRGTENHCGSSPCPQNATCQSGFGIKQYRCICPKGFTGEVCEIDIDECLTTCSPFGVCINTFGSFNCSSCIHGYEGNGFTCTDIDECSTKVDNCSSVAVCSNIPGSFQCLCPPGFQGDGVICRDINECLDSTSYCSINSNCTNLNGSYLCTCLPGFTGDGKTCTDINECLSGNHNCAGGSVCVNTIGSFGCECPKGYRLNGSNICVDIDECSEQTAHCITNAECHNLIGTFECRCKPGYVGDPQLSCTGNGLNSTSPGETCMVLKTNFPHYTSGVYWIVLNTNIPFSVYCDMETEGGGWTLVWSYTFTDYNKFSSSGNAVTPGPKNLGNAILSDTAPQSETDYNAIDFLRWQSIGSEFMVKSNINNWIACVPGTGSFVTKTAGKIDCTVIKKLASCTATPATFGFDAHNNCYLTAVKDIYLFDTSLSLAYPKHNPCGKTRDSHLTNVQNPHGNIYLR